MWANRDDLGILIHYFDNEDTWLGCTQVSSGYTGKSTMYLIGRCPQYTTTIYIDIANDYFSHGDSSWESLSPSLTKEDVTSNLMIVMPTLTHPFVYDDSNSLNDFLGEQANAPYIYGLNFEPYSDYYSPSLNHPCDIPVTKCPEGYTAVLGIGDNSIENLQKFNFPSDLELYYREYINLNEMKAYKFSKKFTIDSTTPFSNATLQLDPGYTQNFIRIDIENPFGFSITENINLRDLSSTIISNRFSYIPNFYNLYGFFEFKGDTVFLGWVASEEDTYEKIWDGYLYISSDTIKTAEQAKAFFATNTAEIVCEDGMSGFIELQEIQIEQPEPLNLTFPKGLNPSLNSSESVYCYFTPMLENGEIDPDKNTKEYRKTMYFSFEASYMRQRLYDDIVSNSNNIDHLTERSSYPTFSFMDLNVSSGSPYDFVTYMYPNVPYIFSNVFENAEVILNIGTFGKSLPGGSFRGERYCHWIRLNTDSPLEYEMTFLGNEASKGIKGINFPPNVKLIWKDGVAPSFKAGKDYRIKITFFPVTDDKYDYKQPCLCTWEEY